jgi:hypothetical protein
VTPSRIPHRAAVRISSMSAVSRKIFIGQAPSGSVEGFYAHRLCRLETGTGPDASGG